jgi:hypothetical protein
MKGKRLFAAALAAAVMLSAAALADSKNDEKKPDKEKGPANYMHVVVFHLKKDAPKDAVSSAIADCHTMLADIPSVRGLKVGRPAERGTPDVPKQNYDFALVVMVENFDGLKAYLEHPKHLEFVKKHGPNFDLEKLQIFDFSDQKK